MMSNSIDEAIAKAKEAASNLPAETVAGAVQVQGLGRALTLEDMEIGGLADIAAWLKVTEFGMTIGADKTLFDEIELILPLADVAYSEVVRYGNPAKYEKTYNRETTVEGDTWPNAILRAKKVDPKANPYRAADLPFIVVADLVNKKKEVLVEAGKRIGHSTSVTNFKKFLAFTKELRSKGVDPTRDTIKVTIGFEEQKNDKGTWGVITFGAWERYEGELPVAA
ncbi:hypothetical protein IZ6_24590 [Terrihabitans soli]|uniref:Uncharacterized protein n=1 Tax=Terrihabitans soli TaxID=708113 RepID=A0A6S6QMM9_9HYPH|nr:hypothetical protein [Terrihabitans soli]BCJ91724.1 hypothetical protein IZ6_24590 [Terrihabitans soli]